MKNKSLLKFYHYTVSDFSRKNATSIRILYASPYGLWTILTPSAEKQMLGGVLGISVEDLEVDIAASAVAAEQL
jgi:hypothetical protein